jgi:F-type H+-transporting ATPase subunit gamma
MAGLRELRSRIASVRNTRKTTYAMKLVSAAKLRRTQEAATRSKLYTQGLFELLGTLTRFQEDAIVIHPLMKIRPTRKVAVVVVGGSRGLAGAYNTNISRAIEQFRETLHGVRAGQEVEWTLIGKKTVEYFKRHRLTFTRTFEDLPEDPLQWPLEALLHDLEKRFMHEEIDEVVLIYTEFRSALSLVPTTKRLLPLEQNALLSQVATSGRRVTQQAVGSHMLFEPSARDVFLALIPRIFRTFVRQACLESKTSEHASRMTSMDAATKNAGELIDILKLRYNKQRQSNITSELLDIIGGSEAIK